MSFDRVSKGDDELSVRLNFSNDLGRGDGGGVETPVGFLGRPPGDRERGGRGGGESVGVRGSEKGGEREERG